MLLTSKQVLIVALKFSFANAIKVLQTTENYEKFNSSLFGAIVMNSSLEELNIGKDGMTVCGR